MDLGTVADLTGAATDLADAGLTDAAADLAGAGDDFAGAGAGAVIKQADAESGRIPGVIEGAEGLNTCLEAAVCLSRSRETPEAQGLDHLCPDTATDWQQLCLFSNSLPAGRHRCV